MKQGYKSSLQWYLKVYNTLRHTHSVDTLKRGIRTMYSRIATQTKQQVEKDLRKLIEATVEEFEQKTGITVNDSFVSDIVTAVITGKLYKNKWSLDKAVKDISKRYEDVVDGIVENDSSTGVITSVLAVINPNDSQYQHKVTTKRGTLYVPKIGSATSTLMRTTLEHGYQRAIVELAEIADEHTEKKIMIRWISALAYNTCEVCESRHNELYRPEDLPLEHPNGQCEFCIEYT